MLLSGPAGTVLFVSQTKTLDWTCKECQLQPATAQSTRSNPMQLAMRQAMLDSLHPDLCKGDRRAIKAHQTSRYNSITNTISPLHKVCSSTIKLTISPMCYQNKTLFQQQAVLGSHPAGVLGCIPAWPSSWLWDGARGRRRRLPAGPGTSGSDRAMTFSERVWSLRLRWTLPGYVKTGGRTLPSGGLPYK